MTISIITVVLNDLDNLKITYKSLSEQSCKNFQWIIKDGGSSDDTENFIQSIINTSDMNICVVVEADSSLYDAMNQSIKYANGDYYLFLNAGDCLACRDTILIFFKKVNNDVKKYDFIYGDCVDVTVDGKEIYKKARLLRYLQHSLPTSHQAIFYHSILFNDFKYPLNYQISADYAFTAQIFFKGYKDYLKLDYPICKFHLGGISQVNRKILLKEGFYIHRNIVGDNYMVSYFKYLKTYIAFIFLDNFPELYRVLRKYLDKTIPFKI